MFLFLFYFLFQRLLSPCLYISQSFRCCSLFWGRIRTCLCHFLLFFAFSRFPSIVRVLGFTIVCQSFCCYFGCNCVCDHKFAWVFIFQPFFFFYLYFPFLLTPCFFLSSRGSSVTVVAVVLNCKARVHFLPRLSILF